MEFSEKLLALRKNRDFTQEDLAEKLNISRQSVSKWESGQAVPELDKIVALSMIFDVTTDYLLKPSELEELSAKTELLERQQEQMMEREKRRNKMIRCTMYSVGIYLVFLAVFFIGHFYFEIWNPSVITAEFFLATAAVIFVWAKGMTKQK